MHPAGAGSAVKPKSWSLTLGLVEMDRSNESAYPCARVMAIVGLKQLIWTYVDVAKLLVAEIVTPATSEGYGLRSVYKAANLLAGAEMWMTKGTPTEKVESVVLGVAAGSRVTSFDVASLMSTSTHPMCVEEVAADGTVGATLIAWSYYGTHSGDWRKPSNYTPATIAVETTATRFKVSVRRTDSSYCNAGVTIFRAAGVAP